MLLPPIAQLRLVHCNPQRGVKSTCKMTSATKKGNLYIARRMRFQKNFSFVVTIWNKNLSYQKPVIAPEDINDERHGI